jgi:hypothetical protein
MKTALLVLCLCLAGCAKPPLLGVTVSNTPDSPECVGALCTSRK